MTVNWIGLIGENNQMIPQVEITNHSLTHDKAKGYRFLNPPNEKYFARWQPIFFQGSKLHEYWRNAEDKENLSYIFLPFCDDFIFIYLEKKQSGNRIATILHSKICQNGNYLADQCINSMEGMMPPSPRGIDISINDDHITIPSSKNSGIGLSTWLFLDKKIKSSVGVSSGVPLNLLEIIFPEVSSWLIEDESQIFTENAITNKSSLMQLIRNNKHPRLAVNDFLMLEEISSAFGVDKDILTQIFLKDKGVNIEINAEVEVELRINLGDRVGALNLVVNENKLITKWMNQPKLKYNEVPFPFTISELSKVINWFGDDLFHFLKSCLDLMKDYPTESKIQMAKILTRYGAQENLEQIWKSIDSSPEYLINEDLSELLLWRNNPNINDFWKIIELIERPNIHIENNSKRLLLEKIIPHSVTSSDLTGVMNYVSDILMDNNQYDFDWGIMTKIEPNHYKILFKVNEIYSSPLSIQKRIILYINRKLDMNRPWRIQDFIPPNRKNLILDKNWMQPLLDSLDKKRDIYSFKMPSDAYDWISSLSPDQYIEALNDPTLIKYLSEEKGLKRISLIEWPNPKALSNSLTEETPNLEKKRIWANLYLNPSMLQRIRYYQDYVLYGISYIFIFLALFTLINTLISINENELFKTFFNSLPLSVIQLINESFWPIFEFFVINFDGYSIPFVNHPVLLITIFFGFCPLIYYLLASAKEKRIKKSDFIKDLKK